jgi:tetratricopeptide (TPR) repeat protein
VLLDKPKVTVDEMVFRFRSYTVIHAVALSLMLCASLPTHAQTVVETEEVDTPAIKLFERAQDAHERRDYETALKLYEEAIKLRPVFPEAEYQRGNALISLHRPAEALKAFQRAAEQLPEWPLPQAMLGTLALQNGQAGEAEQFLRRAFELGAKKTTVLVLAADSLRVNPKSSRESMTVALRLLREATVAETGATAKLWTARGWMEAALGDKQAALVSFQQALKLDAQTSEALIARAELRAGAGDFEGALADAQTAQRLAPNNVSLKAQVIHLYLQANRKEEARRAWEALDAQAQAQPEIIALHNLMMSCEETPENRAALEKLLTETPRDASLLACLGASYRRAAPARSLEFYHRAADIEPNNVDLAVGYTAALVQARRFEAAIALARRVLTVAPDKHEAHANLATALYESKRFAEAIEEFRWLAAAKPDLAATYFFIATAHDSLGEYTQALAAYEDFLSRANAGTNKLEIEKVNLRLPSLRNQVKRGEGAKPKKVT